MAMGGAGVKCLSPQNTSRVSGVNLLEQNLIQWKSMVTTSSDLINQQKKHNMPPYCSCGVIQVSPSPDIHIWLKRGHLQVLSRKVRWYLPMRYIQEPSETPTSASLATSAGVLRLNHDVNDLALSRIWTSGLCRHLDDTTQGVWRHVMFFSVLLRLKIGH